MIPIDNQPLLMRNVTRASLMLLRLLVVDEQFTVLAIPTGFFLGDSHNREDGMRLVEDRVHFFEGSVGGFGVEEVDHGDDEGVAVRKTC